MADKEATVYIVDMGSSMGEIRNGRKESDLDWAMTYVWEKITSTVATDRKGAQLGVIGLRTDRMVQINHHVSKYSHPVRNRERIGQGRQLRAHMRVARDRPVCMPYIGQGYG
ncbi:hypothetical protein OEA41_005734 [Lepraria neglecta]|uniref:Uncharacterized protein n=1 Tax=Lepraria neglecta TaxID=209136 RepID=A0AAD9Z7S7_9LECA|nr:hypothetical protein OEA41_005734 [Lepraria neglecta]